MSRHGKVYIVGAGPGDPGLITLKGKEILGKADVVVYTGSLLNPEILKYAKDDAELHDSAKMSMERIVQKIVEAAKNGKIVVRLHDGDPSFYGAIKELMDALEMDNIEYEVIPGVSSLQAAAASLKRELTLPGVSQTVIVTRPEGRTPVTKADNLVELARHGATMAIFLGAQLIETIVEKLRLGGYSLDTPVAVVYKASWPEQKIIRGTLADITEKVKAADVRSTALILVGEAIEPKSYDRSKLYDPEFSHAFRRGRKNV
ncbi:MAG: precorrin-4 C(11)-methyltransferase [Candidatus Bathyarchaeota archaeon]|nr:precorrin-4 C(11)-methyltransferase [Candidatus Bathyarchaeota archaeon]MCX8177214.1 precorrin-4 C(11)-methyltransferase [Candidatus Bathyarchaeota archaeon]MDW8193543.1 precorrin-4 C(11)-methyltransferase [Nitrososphaerota archaeon]